MTLTASIFLYKHSTDFCLILCLTSFCSCLIGLIEKFSFATWAIALLSSKHFCCRKLHPKILGTCLIKSSLFGRKMLYINSHFMEKIANISFMLKFTYLITPFYFTIQYQLISALTNHIYVLLSVTNDRLYCDVCP